MPFGELTGKVQDWEQKDIDSAKNAGLFFTPYNQLRDYGTNKGYAVDWDASTGNVKINNNPYTSQQLTNAGFYNNNGRWMGSDVGLNKFFSGIKQDYALRDYGTNKGYNIDWDSNTGNVLINKNPYTNQQLYDYGLYNLNGRWMGNENNLNKLFGSFNSTPTNNTLTNNNLTNNNSNNNDYYIKPAKDGGSWYLSNWKATNDKWDTQPILTIDGRTYKFNTPTEYINALKSLKNQGVTGDVDKLIKDFEATYSHWPQTQDAIKQSQKPQQPPQNNQNNNQTFDYNQFSDVVSKKILEGLPQLTKYTPYQSQYTDDLINTLNNIKNYKSFDFNENNPALKQAQDSAMGRVRQDMAKRGRVFDTYADVKMQEAAQGLIPTYYQLEQNQYNKDRANMYDILTAIQNADTTAYNRYNQNYLYNRADEINAQGNYISALDYGNRQTQEQFNRDLQSAPLTGQFQGQNTVDYNNKLRENAIADENKVKSEEIASFGVPLTPIMRQYRQVFQSMPQNIGAQIIQLGNQNGGFAAEINRRMQSNPNDPLIPYLQAARAMKVLSDPALLQQYGAEYGMQSTQINQNAKAIAQKEVLDKLEVLKKQIDNQKALADLNKVIAEVRKNNADAAMKELEASYLPQKLKAEIALELEKISTEKAQQSNYYANAQESMAGAALKGEQMNTERAQQAKYNADAAKTSNENNSSTVAGAAYQEFLSSNMTPEEWLKSNNNAEALGKTGALKEFISMLKSTGKFGNSNSLEELLKQLE